MTLKGLELMIIGLNSKSLDRLNYPSMFLKILDLFYSFFKPFSFFKNKNNKENTFNFFFSFKKNIKNTKFR